MCMQCFQCYHIDQAKQHVATCNLKEESNPFEKLQSPSMFDKIQTVQRLIKEVNSKIFKLITMFRDDHDNQACFEEIAQMIMNENADSESIDQYKRQTQEYLRMINTVGGQRLLALCQEKLNLVEEYAILIKESESSSSSSLDNSFLNRQSPDMGMNYLPFQRINSDSNLHKSSRSIAH